MEEEERGVISILHCAHCAVQRVGRRGGGGGGSCTTHHYSASPQAGRLHHPPATPHHLTQLHTPANTFSTS